MSDCQLGWIQRFVWLSPFVIAFHVFLSYSPPPPPPTALHIFPFNATAEAMTRTDVGFHMPK